ncbi:glycosyltransferase [Candidatus Microgenomates bacterium]|nr:glycosyltransferase [Candidatus Microgenomates bacterium]
MRVTIIIPTYNERENISLLLKELLQRTSKLSKYKFNFLIVDDNSPDGTGGIVKEFISKNKKIHLLTGKKEGLGKAMVRGYKYALKNLKPDVIITNEADFGFSFKHLPLMLKEISAGYDVIVASRHVGDGKSEGWTLNRKLNHFIANSFFAKFIAGIDIVYDKNGAFRAIRVKNVLDKIKWNRFPTNGFGFFFYQIHELSKLTDKFYEFPSTFTFRTRGESKVSFNPKYIKAYTKDTLEYIKLAFKIRLERSKI